MIVQPLQYCYTIDAPIYLAVTSLNLGESLSQQHGDKQPAGNRGTLHHHAVLHTLIMTHGYDVVKIHDARNALARGACSHAQHT